MPAGKHKDIGAVVVLCRKTIFKCIILPILIIMLSGIAASPVFAAAGNGSGGGSGNGSGGNGEPLSITSSIPADGQKDVSVDTQIELVFSKNVTNMAVKDNNAKCFSLWAGSESVPAKAVLADDQVEPEKKNNVTVIPADRLKPGTVYTLKVAAGLESKSGASLGKEIQITFTTAGNTTANTPESTSGNTAVNTPGSTSTSSPVVIIIAACILLAVILVIIFTARRKAK